MWKSGSPAARVARAALVPASLLYGVVVDRRRRLFDDGYLPTYTPALPTISVGNLTVGGTGKTPIAAWIAGALLAQGARPAIVLRGYRGGDEALVHRALTPGAAVIVDPDRLRGIRQAAADGRDVAILDDGFQRRSVRRAADIVLVSADAWSASRHLLPAGPWREPFSAIQRATLVIITRKAADDAAVHAVGVATQAVAHGMPVAIASLRPDALRTMDGDERPLDALRGTPVHAVAGIGDPDAFFAQLRAAGAVVTPHIVRDHHAYTADEAARLARAAGRAPVVCTLKDAVKLGLVWPRQVQPLLYVSQRVEFDRGIELVRWALDPFRAPL
jgi:tetraacyldisaccharide 4'-kinase